MSGGGVSGASEVLISARGGLTLQSLRETWDARELMVYLAWRDVRARYKQTFLGFLWLIIQPLVMTAVLVLVFRNVAGFSSGETPYVIFVLTGLVVWSLFSATMSRAATSLISNAHLIRKVYFPRLVAPLAGVVVAALEFSIMLFVLIMLLLVTRGGPTSQVWLVGAAVITAVTAALGVGLLIAALSIKQRDLHHALPLLTQVWLFASPVAYPISAIPSFLQPAYRWNPVTPAVELFREGLLRTYHADVNILPGAFVAGIFLLVGLAAFGLFERRAADVL